MDQVYIKKIINCIELRKIHIKKNVHHHIIRYLPINWLNTQYKGKFYAYGLKQRFGLKPIHIDCALEAPVLITFFD